MRRTRVLMITGRADVGGGPEHIFQLSKHLANDCEVFIAAPNEPPYWDRFVDLVGPDRILEIPHRRFSWAALRRLTVWGRQKNIDILHSHGRAGGLYGRLGHFLLNCPCIHTPNCPLSFRSWRAPFYWMGELVLSWTTEKLIAVSETEALSMRRQLFRNRGITTILNGVQIPEARVHPDILSRRPLNIVHVTRFVPQKNSSMVLDILDHLRPNNDLDDFHVDMVGDGPGRAALENSARSRGLEKYITFHGAQPSVKELFLNGFCVLSTSRWEGLPIAVLEGLALGLPTIATNTSGNNDVVSSSVGRLFPIDDASAAASHLIELRDSTECWQRLSDGAVSLVQSKFSVQSMAADTIALYKNPFAAT